MTYITRQEWGAPALTGNALRTTSASNRTGFVVHWDGGRNPKNAADEIALLKAYDRHHRVGNRGGFPYNLAVGPVTGNVYEGRGLGRVGAHAGGANTANIGVILIGGPGNLTAAGKRGLQEAYRIANQYAGRTLAQRVHSDINSTACPGAEIREWVKGGGLVAPSGGSSGGGTSVKAPAYPLKRGWYFGPRHPLWNLRSVSGYHGHRADLRRWQQRMKDRGWQITADGLYGPETRGVALAFQREKGLQVDGLIGPETWGAAWTAPIT